MKYRITGKLTTPLAGASMADLRMCAYKFLSSSSMQTFGTCDVNADGSFTLEYDYPSPGPMEVDIMPIPREIENYFGVFNIERSIPGLLFPHVHIAPGNWRLSGGVYTRKVSITIPASIWKRWAWLAEEFTVIGWVKKRVGEAYLPVPHAYVMGADVDLPLPYGEGVYGGETDQWGYFSFSFPRVVFFIDHAVYNPALQRYGTESWPNLIFHITQVIGGMKTIIYEEDETDARPMAMWDIPSRTLTVTLITEEGITNDEIAIPFPPGCDFLFHGIGAVQPHSITDGYATTTAADDIPGLRDSPFGATLHINGQFEVTGATPPRYYRVLYAPWNGGSAPSASDFQPILHESWTVSRFNDATRSWDPEVVEPESDAIPGIKVYEIPDYLDITLTSKTRLISWTTTRQDNGVPRYPDGKYDLLIEAYDASGNPVALNAPDPDLNRLTVMIDNSWPEALLRVIKTFDILRTDEMMPYTPVCPVFSKVAGALPVTFDATDEEGHLLNYSLSFITGHNVYMDQFLCFYTGKTGANENFVRNSYHKGTLVSTTVLPARPPGGFAGETITWDITDPDVVKCAYQIRLGVTARTINGYGYIHYAEDTMHISVEP
jgi:hypothetical protein